METKEEEYFTNLLSDKALRAKIGKLVCENPRDVASLEIILKQKWGWSGKQREWMQILLDRKGKSFVAVAEEKKVEKKEKGKFANSK